jgi:hypothetical protein
VRRGWRPEKIDASGNGYWFDGWQCHHPHATLDVLDSRTGPHGLKDSIADTEKPFNWFASVVLDGREDTDAGRADTPEAAMVACERAAAELGLDLDDVPPKGSADDQTLDLFGLRDRARLRLHGDRHVRVRGGPAMTWPDDIFPPCGPCGFCDSNDKRHRAWDAIVERHEAGDSIADLAADYSETPETIERVVREWDPEGQRWSTEGKVAS